MNTLKLEIADLRVNGLTQPLNIDTPQPVFSWRMDCARTGARQTAYQVTVSSGNAVLWDSGRVESDASFAIPYPAEAPALTPETDYTWKVTIWDETGSCASSEVSFSTGLMGTDLSAWHGAKWIGPEEIQFCASTLAVFRIRFRMQVEAGGTCAGILFGAGDPRYASSIQNNYLIHGENYIAYRLDVSQIPARVNVTRKGYAPGEEEEVLLDSMEVPADVISMENRYGEHEYEIAVSGCQMEYMTVDGTALETDESYLAVVSSPLHQVTERTHMVLNPTKVIGDTPVFPRLCEVGFTTDAQTPAFFRDFGVYHYGGEQNLIFGEKTGAGYSVFAGKEGLKVDDSCIEAAPGTLACADPSFGSVPMLRRDLMVTGPVASAKIYAAGRGIFELTLNGQKIGDEYLSAGDMDFRRHIFYEAFDVTDQLHEGRNTLGAVLASGWYNDQASYTLATYNFYGDTQSLLALLAIRYEDGSVEYIPTDGNWQYYGQGPIRYAGNFNGETYDATRDALIHGWDTPAYDAALRERWQNAAEVDSKVCGLEPEIVAKPDPGVAKYGELTAVYHSTQTRGSDQDTVYIYDMGVNMVGVPEITFPEGKAGQVVTIRYSEILYPVLAEDNPYCYGELGGLILTENLRGALVTDRYIMKGEPGETFQPLHTFHGYRYVEISGIDHPIPAENIKGILLSSVKQTAFYESSNPLVNQLFVNINRSTIENHLSVPTDCPQRDERLGWAGDAQIYSETATYMADLRSFYRYFCILQKEAQGPDGTFHLYAPGYAPIGYAYALGYTWNTAGVVIPWQTYLQYGDPTVLRENYPAMRLHIYGMMDMKAEGRNYLTSHIGFLGDHLSVKDTDPSLMDNAQYYRAVRFVQQAAERLGEKEDAAAFAAFADGLRQEWNAVFVGADHRTQNAEGVLQDTQASYALPLMCGVFSDENTPYAGQYLEDACAAAGYTMTTGFMGTGPLLPALTEGGHVDAAYRLFEQTGYPSWLYPVLNGATTVWERWGSYTIENGFGGQNGMNSFNHYSLGAVASWMLEYQAGIQRGSSEDSVGFRRFVLQPTPGGSFTHVKADYDSVCGRISSGWTAENGELRTYDAVVPANTCAVLYLPVSEERAQRMGQIDGAVYCGMTEHNRRQCARFELTAGTYHFE
ncbi:MAG: family 78 glycoside hydrolase catalytic domain [Lachnospiraceae bacterium]|nr:family 78 glycoside hydrolase catalytic domain [Lachnospiraceae bacterium]